MRGTTEHHVKNSRHLADFMKDFTIDDDDSFVTHDVLALFTNTPIPETLNYIRHKLENDVTLCNRTNLNKDDIMELLELICSTTYLNFDGTTMQQKFGTAMGSPVSALIANFYMEKLEHKALQTAAADCRPKIWKRYVDDVLDVIKKHTVKNFTDDLNSIDYNNSIKFAYEEETNGVTRFLDLLINRQQDKTVKIQV